MKVIQSKIIIIALGIGAFAALLGLTWANYSYSYKNPGGNDFLPRYMGIRLFLFEGKSPYGQQATREIQEMIYGRSARPGEDQAFFEYPFFSMVLMAPFALIPDYNMARAVWMTALEISLVGVLLISLSLSRWKIPVWSLVVLLCFSVFWYHSFRPLINGNPSILTALLIALVFLAIRNGYDGFGGILLAFAMIKPQIVFLLVVYVLVWSAYQKRWQLFWGFVSSLVFLIVTSFLFLPSWLIENLRQIYQIYTTAAPNNPREILLAAAPGAGNQLGWALTIVMVVVLFIEWRASLHKDFIWFYWTALLTLAANNLIGIPTSPQNYIVMLPALILVFSTWDAHWRVVGKILITASIVVLFFGLWWLFLATLPTDEIITQSPIMFFPLPFFLLVTLYWVRWWVVRPTRPLLERLR